MSMTKIAGGKGRMIVKHHHVDFQQNPFIVIWEATRACQLQCVHCRAESQKQRDPRELSLTEAKHLIDAIYEMNNPMLVLTGGDCLMRDDIFEIIEYAVHKGVRISMTPSATPNVTKEAMTRAKQAGLARWAFSIDGPTAEVHDHFRGTPGSFQLTMEAIQYLHELELPLQVNTVISNYNIELLEEMGQLMEKLGVVLWNVFCLVPTGRGQVKDMISPLQHELAFRWLYNYGQRVPFDIKTTAGQHYRRVVLQEKHRQGQLENMTYLDVLKEGRLNSVDGFGRAPRGVNDGNGFLFISHIGDVYPSGLLPIHAGNVRETPLATIYRESPIFRSLRDPNQYKGKCGQCEFRFICGGSRSRAYALTGDYLAAEPCCVYIPQQLRGHKSVVSMA